MSEWVDERINVLVEASKALRETFDNGDIDIDKLLESSLAIVEKMTEVYESWIDIQEYYEDGEETDEGDAAGHGGEASFTVKTEGTRNPQSREQFSSWWQKRSGRQPHYFQDEAEGETTKAHKKEGGTSDDG